MVTCMERGGAVLLELERSKPLYQQVREGLRRLIIEGRLQSGETVTEVKLSEMFGVSRTPVREALKQLAVEGLVQQDSFGYRIYSPTAEDLADVYVCRAAIEAQAIALLTIRSCTSVTEIAELEALVATTEEVLKQEEHVESVVSLNTQFHELIVRASGNPELILLYDTIRLRSVLCRGYSLRSAEARDRSAAEHRQIIDLLKQNDPVSAERFLRLHVLRAGLRALNVIDPEGKVQTPSALYLRQWAEG